MIDFKALLEKLKGALENKEKAKELQGEFEALKELGRQIYESLPEEAKKEIDELALLDAILAYRRKELFEKYSPERVTLALLYKSLEYTEEVKGRKFDIKVEEVPQYAG